MPSNTSLIDDRVHHHGKGDSPNYLVALQISALVKGGPAQMKSNAQSMMMQKMMEQMMKQSGAGGPAGAANPFAGGFPGAPPGAKLEGTSGSARTCE